MKHTLRRTFVTGLVMTMPLFITLAIIQFFWGRVESALSPLVLHSIRWLGLGSWLEVAWIDYLAPLLSVTLGVLAIYLVGLVGGNVLGQQLLHWLEGLVLRVPIVRTIYGATRQVLDTFSKASGKSFSRVVLVTFPRPGMFTLGLVTGKPAADIQGHCPGAAVSVFVPTTPNPTSGWLLFIPENELIPLQMSVDDAFKMIISGGVLGGQTPH